MANAPGLRVSWAYGLGHYEAPLISSCHYKPLAKFLLEALHMIKAVAPKTRILIQH